MFNDSHSLDEIQLAVLSYLEDHPNAADSAEAIQRWWLLERMAKLTKTEVSEALDKLVSNQFLGRSTLGDGREIFFLNAHTAAQSVN